jgi:hypothetical protein
MTNKGDAGYQQHKEAVNRRSREGGKNVRDIGDLPPVANTFRREECRLTFRRFCETYGAESFPLQWSDDHLKAIGKIESAVLQGLLFAIAMARGSGKTTLLEWACLWCLCYGHRAFLMLIGADMNKASQMLDTLKSQIENNDLLLEDFPEVCFPVRALERISQRAKGQTYQGKPTHIGWTADEITLPWIPGAPSAGAAVRVAGITGNIRGSKHSRPDGTSIRPSLVLIDDPQTDESSSSPSQVASREKVLAQAILGLAGPGKKIAGLAAITVIKPDDLADRLLDRHRHPTWQGERMKLVYEWPTAEELWGQYAELRRDGQRHERGTGEADEFYRLRQAEMDAGSRVAWPARKNEDEISAIQHAWNLRIDRGESAFNAEYQNQPIADDIASDKLDKRALALRAENIERGVVPAGHNTLTAFCDLQDKLLFWLVASWSDTFGGHVVAYGTYPDQASSFFEARHAKRTLGSVQKGASQEAAWRAGLDKVATDLLSRDFRRQDGTLMQIQRMLFDANYGRSTQVVRNFCLKSPFSARIFPSHGKGVPASSRPLNDSKGQRGDRLGLNWRTGKLSNTNQLSAIYDTNSWKSFVSARLRLHVGDKEAITFHAGEHDLLLEHLTAEFPVQSESKHTGRVVDEWKERPGADNHWFDCLVGAAVAASIAGVVPASSESGARQRRKVEIPAGPDGKRVIVTKRHKA